MKFNSSRRKFLKAGLILPAVGLVSTNDSYAFSKMPDNVAYRVLGKTGLKVSTVGSGVGIEPDPQVIARAIDLGVNYFDTARMYGNGSSERITGTALKGKRDKVILATKTDGRTKSDIFKDMEASLNALNTDYVDIYHLHSRDTPDTITDESVEACEMLKKEGKTRFIGVSTHDVHAVADHILKIGKFDVVQTTYSYAIGGAPLRQEAISRLYAAGIGMVAMKVIIAVAGFIPRDINLRFIAVCAMSVKENARTMCPSRMSCVFWHITILALTSIKRRITSGVCRRKSEVCIAAIVPLVLFSALMESIFVTG